MDQKIVYFKLISGDDIISYVENSDGEYVILNRPLQLIAHNTMKGATVRMTKWSAYTEENDFPIKLKHVILSAKPTEEIEDFYLDALDILDQKMIERDIEYENDLDEDTTTSMFERFSNTSIVVH